jgi:hypothetical protein
MTAVAQFLVLKRQDKWVVKSKDLERFFSIEQQAVDAAIRLANDSGKEGKPGAVLFQKSKTRNMRLAANRGGNQESNTSRRVPPLRLQRLSEPRHPLCDGYYT